MATFITLTSLFLLSFLAASLFPAQSEILFMALILNNKINVLVLLFVVSAGNILGACFNWWLGIYVRKFQDKRWFPFTPQDLEKAQNVFNKYGRWSLLFSWLPIVGDPLTFAAGVLRVPFPAFLGIVSLGKVMRYVIIAYLTVQYID